MDLENSYEYKGNGYFMPTLIIQGCISTLLSILMVVLFVNRKYLLIVNPLLTVFYMTTVLIGFSKANFGDKQF